MSRDINYLLKKTIKQSQIQAPHSYNDRKDFLINYQTVAMKNQRSNSNNTQNTINTWRKINKTLKGGLFIYNKLDSGLVMENNQPLAAQILKSYKKNLDRGLRHPRNSLATNTLQDYSIIIPQQGKDQSYCKAQRSKTHASNYQDKTIHQNNCKTVSCQNSPKSQSISKQNQQLQSLSQSLTIGNDQVLFQKIRKMRLHHKNLLQDQSSNIQMEQLKFDQVQTQHRFAQTQCVALQDNPNNQNQKSFEIQPFQDESPNLKQDKIQNVKYNQNEQISFLLDKIIQCGLLSQGDQEQNFRIVKPNIEYFLHQLKLCICQTCTCGLCKCNAPAFKPLASLNLLKASIQSESNNLSPPLIQEHYDSLSFQHRFQQISPRLQSESTNQSSYKLHDADCYNPQIKFNKKEQQTAPFIARSNYQTNFYDWKSSQDSIRLNQPENLHYDRYKVLSSQPGSSTYQSSYTQNTEPMNCGQSVEDIKKIQNHKTILKVYPNNYASTYQQMYKSEKQDRCKGQLNQKDDQVIPSVSHPSQYVSVSNNSYRGIQEPFCPAKQYKKHPLSQLNHLFMNS